VDFKDILRRRRMVRAYEPKPVLRSEIERIVGTVRRAPSAGFSQGQRLLVVTDFETRKKIAELLEEHGPARGRVPNDDQWITAAPVLIVVGVREDDYHDRYRKPDKLIDGRELEWPIPVACCITIGKPADDSNWSGMSSRLTQARRPVDDLVRWERWDAG
jgi:nitroreductase